MKTIFTLFFFGFIAWVVGLVWFFMQIPTAPAASDSATDTIIVLTGAKGRIEEAELLLALNNAKYMLISGMGENTTLEELITPENFAKLKKRISPGREARSTYGNALESARWLRHYNFESVRLVTSWYHIPRSVQEFERQVPDGTLIIAHPVFPENFNPQTWWRNPAAAKLVVSEYNKYLAGFLRSMLEY